MGAGAVDTLITVALRTWRKTLRRPVVLTFSFVQPLLWMLFFGFLFQRYPVEFEQGREVRYLDFLAPGVCAMTVLFGASQSGIAFIRDLQTGFLQRMLATPAPVAWILGGKVLADAVRLIVQAFVVVLLAKLIGARLDVDWALLPVAVCGLFLFGFAFACLSCAIALWTRAQESMAVFVHVVNMPVLFTSSALVPSKQMPEWMAWIAGVNPLTAAVDLWRGALLSWGPNASAVGWKVGVLFALAAGAFGLAALAMRRAGRVD